MTQKRLLRPSSLNSRSSAHDSTSQLHTRTPGCTTVSGSPRPDWPRRPTAPPRFSSVLGDGGIPTRSRNGSVLHAVAGYAVADWGAVHERADAVRSCQCTHEPLVGQLADRGVFIRALLSASRQGQPPSSLAPKWLRASLPCVPAAPRCCSDISNGRLLGGSATRPMFAPGPFHATWPTFAPRNFNAIPVTVSTTSSTSSSARPTPTKTGSGRGCESVATGQPVMYGAFPWPDPYYGMVRAVPSAMPQVYTGRSTPGRGSSKAMEAGGAGRPVATPSSSTTPVPPQSIAKQAPTASPPRDDSVSLYSTIPKAQPSDSTPPYQSPPSTTSYPPYSSHPGSSSQMETYSPAPTITFPPPAPAPTSTISPPAPEEEVPLQINKVEAKPVRQVRAL